nr:hypothetical protein [Mycoplasmopsis bovis]
MVETEDLLITRLSKYNKVGIVEVSDLDSNYLLSQNDQFQFIKTHCGQHNNENVYNGYGV